MIGESIGNFKVVKRLGSGGMGDVFLAEHKDLHTPVAVKVLNDNISTNHEHVQRFFNEARVVSKIKHAGTVKIFDSGFHKNQAYLIMELLEGESLAKRIEHGGAMAVASIVEISRQIASVLDATHRQGVIHRDLKPENIYLVPDDERSSGERVKVLDFGIAKLSGTMAMVSPKTSGTMGTPAYMAPEQWGDSSNVDWRADAYSLGCVMFEIACGRPPFLAATIPEAFVKHTQTPPPAPSSLVPGLPDALERLILRLLAKEPADRAVSMGQVTRELAELAGEPLSTEMRRAPSQPAVAVTMALPTTLGGSAAELQVEPPRRRTALIAGIGAVAVAMVIVVVMIAAKGGKTEGARPASAPTGPGGPAAGGLVEPNPEETKPAETQPIETKPIETKPPEVQPVEAKPIETKPVETKPVETKPVDTKPVDTKPVDTKPAEPIAGTKPVQTKPIRKPKPDVKPVVKPDVKPVVKPNAGSGSAKPPEDDDGGWGGRR